MGPRVGSRGRHLRCCFCPVKRGCSQPRQLARCWCRRVPTSHAHPSITHHSTWVHQGSILQSIYSWLLRCTQWRVVAVIQLLPLHCLTLCALLRTGCCTCRSVASGCSLRPQCCSCAPLLCVARRDRCCCLLPSCSTSRGTEVHSSSGPWRQQQLGAGQTAAARGSCQCCCTRRLQRPTVQAAAKRTLAACQHDTLLSNGCCRRLLLTTACQPIAVAQVQVGVHVACSSTSSTPSAACCSIQTAGGRTEQARKAAAIAGTGSSSARQARTEALQLTCWLAPLPQLRVPQLLVFASTTVAWCDCRVAADRPLELLLRHPRPLAAVQALHTPDVGAVHTLCSSCCCC